MSNTKIQISNGVKQFIATPDSVNLSPGDQVTFISVAGTDDAALGFSANAPAFLTPAPTLPPAAPVALPSGATVTFTVSAAPGSCSVMVLQKNTSGTPDADGPQGVLEILTPPHRPGPTDPGQNIT
jgi:hypothetical protein